MRIVSGGQSGVDRAALDAALQAGIACGGWCPKGRRAEDGKIARRYPLTESESTGYRQRTRANVRDSDGTLILVPSSDAVLSGGTALTAREARRFGRPLLIASVGDAANEGLSIAESLAWIRENGIAELNVAGPRESTSPGIYSATYHFMAALLAALIRTGS